MNILGIETSCDETGASVVTNGTNILSNVIASSLAYHKKYGGIIPEIASRKQLEFIQIVVNDALRSAKKKLSDIDGIAVTNRPGLVGSLLVGTCFAQGLSYSQKIPLVEVDHITAHLYASLLRSKNTSPKQAMPQLPAIGLIVSGGHSSLFLIKNFHDIKLLGQTRDDAAGEAYDKVARILGLGYPGGPVIDRLFEKGSNSDIAFSCADLPGTYDFSFSGIKTAVYYFVKRYTDPRKIPVKKIAYSFQKSVVDILVRKSIAACVHKKVSNLIVGGGVAANSTLRRQLVLEGKRHHIKTFFPEIGLCMDNAAMIAGLGFHAVQHNKPKRRMH